MEYLFAAYAVIWILIFGYTVLIGKRLKNLEADLFLLKKAVEGKVQS